MSSTVNTMRINEIDIAKGLGIILVIIGHTLTNEIAQIAIPAIHMPLFFVLSGLVMKEPSCISIKSLFHSERKLFKTYYFWSIFYIVLHYCIYKSISLVKDEIYQTLIFWGIEVLWFIAALAFAKIFIKTLIFYVSKTCFQIIILLGLLIITYIISPYVNTWTLPEYSDKLYLYYFSVAILRIFSATIFVYIGFKCKSTLSKILNTPPALSLIIGLLFLSAVVIGTKYNSIVDMHFIRFGNSIIMFLLFALLGIMGILHISHTIAKTPILNRFMIFSGQESILLMTIHFPLLSFLKNFLQKINMMENMSEYLILLVLLILCYSITIVHSILIKIVSYVKKRGI